MKNPLGTGGAVIKSLKYLNNNFFILYGDNYLNFDIKKCLRKKVFQQWLCIKIIISLIKAM